MNTMDLQGEIQVLSQSQIVKPTTLDPITPNSERHIVMSKRLEALSQGIDALQT